MDEEIIYDTKYHSGMAIHIGWETGVREEGGGDGLIGCQIRQECMLSVCLKIFS